MLQVVTKGGKRKRGETLDDDKHIGAYIFQKYVKVEGGREGTGSQRVD